MKPLMVLAFVGLIYGVVLWLRSSALDPLDVEDRIPAIDPNECTCWPSGLSCTCFERPSAMNFSAISAAFDLFRKGSAVADPNLLQDRGKLAIALSAALTAAAHLAAALGYPLPLDAATVDQLAGGLAAAAYLVVHYASSPQRGLLPHAGPDRDADAPGDTHAAAPVRGEPAEPPAADPVRDQRADPTNLAGG